MFARMVSSVLKPGQGDGFARITEQEVIPLLRKYPGFQDEIVMVSTDGKKGTGVSFWRSQEEAEAYARASFADVLKLLAPYVTTTDEVQTYNVAMMTFKQPETLAHST